MFINDRGRGSQTKFRLVVISLISKYGCFRFPVSHQRPHQPRTQDLSLGKTLAADGHVPHQKFSA
jgi:hypothetical protein